MRRYRPSSLDLRTIVIDLVNNLWLGLFFDNVVLPVLLDSVHDIVVVGEILKRLFVYDAVKLAHNGVLAFSESLPELFVCSEFSGIFSDGVPRHVLAEFVSVSLY